MFPARISANSFMDFETMDWAIPRYPGCKPYQQVPFQWSVHMVDVNPAAASTGHIAHDGGVSDGRRRIPVKTDPPGMLNTRIAGRPQITHIRRPVTKGMIPMALDQSGAAGWVDQRG